MRDKNPVIEVAIRAFLYWLGVVYFPSPFVPYSQDILGVSKTTSAS